MKKRILNLAAIVIMAVGIFFSLIQLDVPVVRAAGCPPTAVVDGCFCGDLVEATGMMVENELWWFCTYRCTCSGGGGGGDPFEIERTIQVLD